MCRGGLVGSELGTLFALGWARFLVGAAATLVGQIASCSGCEQVGV